MKCKRTACQAELDGTTRYEIWNDPSTTMPNYYCMECGERLIMWRAKDGHKAWKCNVIRAGAKIQRDEKVEVMTEQEKQWLSKAIDDLKHALVVGVWDRRLPVHTITNGQAAFITLPTADLSIESSDNGYAVSLLMMK